jgi:hypothetical protein
VLPKHSGGIRVIDNLSKTYDYNVLSKTQNFSELAKAGASSRFTKEALRNPNQLLGNSFEILK